VEEKPAKSSSWKEKLLEARKRQLLYKKKAASYLKQLKSAQEERELEVEELRLVRKDLAHTRDQNRELQVQLERSTQLLIQKEQAEKDLKSAMAGVQKELEASRAEVDSLHKRLESADEKISETELMAGKRFESLRKAQSEIKKLREKIRKQFEEIQELGEELRDSRQGLARMQSEMRENERKKSVAEPSGENL
jgi:chromosome segregation ATPase